MPTDPFSVIHLEDGKFSTATTTKFTDIAPLVAKFKSDNPAKGMLIHFHGGLVSFESAQNVIANLRPKYAQSSTYPVFFAWETGLFETIKNNLRNIVNERAFREIVRKVVEFLLKKIGGMLGTKSGGSAPVSAAKVKSDVESWFEGRKERAPYQDVIVRDEPGMKSAAVDLGTLEAEIRQSIGRDQDLQSAVRDLIEHPETNVMPPGGVEQITKPAPDGSKGVFDAIRLAKKIASIVKECIERWRNGRHHGVLGTAEEEVLRALYIGELGQDFVWGSMKQDALDAWGDSMEAGKECGGTALWQALSAAHALPAPFPRVTLIGHSAGAIKLCHAVEALCKLRPDVQIDAVLLAPAVDFGLFRRTFEKHADNIHRVRLYGMTDEVELEDEMAQGFSAGGVPIGKALYPHSLLYFVSGLLEEEEVDLPLLGMQRYHINTETYPDDEFPNVAWVRKQFASNPKYKAAWSLTEEGAPEELRTLSDTHGGFDNDATTLLSVAAFIAAR